MEIRRSGAHRAMPWANGLGTTLELAIHPDGSRLDEMEWRLSVATVAEPGPFSSLPGVDRVLLMLDDVAAVLRVDGSNVPMRRMDQVSFRGDDDVSLVSVSAPARDLNLMARRGRWRGSMTVVDLAAPQAARSEVSFLLVVSGRADFYHDSVRVDLAPLDLVRLDAAPVTGHGEGVRVDLDRETGIHA